jgi:hypothetical protein
MQIVGLSAGFGGLLRGLFYLDGEPLFGVMEILGAMALLLWVLAKPRESSSTR